MRRTLAILAGIVAAVPFMTSAQTLALDPASIQAQFNAIGIQLSQILTQLSAAQAKGPTYTKSAAFHTQVNQWLQQVSTLGAQLVVIITSSGGFTSGQTTPSQPVTPVSSGPAYSTGSISAVSVGGTSSTLINFTVTGNPTATCQPTTFTLNFGDGQSQVISFPAGCSSQIQPVSHAYPSVGPYTAVLSSGTFATNISVIGSSVGANGGVVTLSTAPGSTNYSVIVTATNVAGPHCLASTYTLDFGDGSTQTITFPASCASAVQTFTHAYPQSQQYTIRVYDAATGVGNTTFFTPSIAAAAGQGNPLQVLSIETTSSAKTITDLSSYHRTLNVNGATVDTTSSTILFNGSSWISTPQSSDFNYGANPFTIDLRFKVTSFPASDGQAALFVQADSAGTDASLGGAGIELYGNKIAFVGRIGNVTYHPFYSNTIISTSTLAVNTWYHVAVVRSGNTVTMYLNGAPAGSMSVSGSANISTGSISIGRYGDLANDYFHGYVDYVHVTNGSARWTTGFSITPSPVGLIF